ncbi:hypothetical protein [Snodgrassella alvi]|uniref:Uncharacterized protein n=1 Tax=Snodgrassella alvi TaxID=1196083 RepID=A0A855FLA5_9NEIS|nr:hypothetical protein [Snodgrassella alvi]PIT59042.1 hypothetical protein BHC57_10260 [Snodgrassella alvi]
MDSKEKKVAPETSECEEKNSFEFTAYLLNYIKVNPIKSISAIILGIGGALLLFFFLHIGYMPDINFESVASILYAIAILGILHILYCLFIFVLPGLTLSYFKENIKVISNKHILCLSINTACIWAFVIGQIINFSPLTEHVYISYTMFSMVIIILSIYGIKNSFKNLNSINKIENKETKQLIINSTVKETKISIIETTTTKNNNKNWITPKIIFLWSLLAQILSVCVLILPILLIILYASNGNMKTEPDWLIFIKLLILIVLISFSSAAIGCLKFKESIRYVPNLSLTIFMIFIIITESFSSIAFSGIKTLRIGEVNSARLIVTGKTCNEINQTLGKKVCKSQSDNAITAICPILIKSRIGNQMVLEFSPLHKITSEENGTVDKNQSTSLKKDTDNKSNNNPKNFYWITTKQANNSDKNTRITQVVILDKSKILSWQPLARIEEKDFNDIKKTSSEPAATSADNNILKLVTLYDAKQKISAGTASDVDEFLLKHCREDIDEFTNKNPAPNK